MSSVVGEAYPDEVSGKDGRRRQAFANAGIHPAAARNPPDQGALRRELLHEIKFDGYRLPIHLNKGRVTAYTRNGLDWTTRFSAIARAFDIPVERAIFDGEVVVVKDGRTNFSELQADLA